MENLELVKEYIVQNHNYAKFLPDDEFLRYNILILKNDGNEVILAMRKAIRVKTFNHGRTLTLYKYVIENGKISESVLGEICYVFKFDIVKLCSIKVFNEDERGKGYGTMLLKAFQYDIHNKCQGKVKIEGSFAPQHKKDTEKTKDFYNKNGFNVHKKIFRKKTLVQKKFKDFNEKLENINGIICVVDNEMTK